MSQLAQRCRDHGLPVTVQRRLVLEALARRADHPTADQIFDEVQQHLPELSRTTVYRVLEAFTRIGVVRKVSHPGATARYEIDTPRHHHLICRMCERVLDLYDPALDSLPVPAAPLGFHVEEYVVQFRGLCADCAAEEAQAPRQ